MCKIFCHNIFILQRYAIALYAVVMCLSIRLSHAGIVPQVAQLSLTNPRDALHRGKRQNFKTIT